MTVSSLVVLFVLIQFAAMAGSMSQNAQAAPLSSRTLGLIINDQDPYSVEVGHYYAKKRRIPSENIIRVSFAHKAILTVAEFKSLASQVAESTPSSVQAYAVAWTEPYAVECNSFTTALAWKFQGWLCANTCAPSELSPNFDGQAQTQNNHPKIRPTMLLAARSVKDAQRLIDRGARSDGSLQSNGGKAAEAIFVRTGDAARNVRARLYPQQQTEDRFAIRLEDGSQAITVSGKKVVLYQTGAMRVDGIHAIDWAPGALADHLTSFGGVLLGAGAQMSALDWLEAGATASYGTVSEPCNHLEKFPHPQVLLKHYLQGATALEAYWRSVAWPAQGVFIGDPLAAPFVTAPSRKRAP